MMETDEDCVHGLMAASCAECRDKSEHGWSEQEDVPSMELSINAAKIEQTTVGIPS